MTCTKRTASPLAAAGNCVALGVGAGATEVIIRFYQDFRTIETFDLIVALVFNVGALGAACLAGGLLAFAATRIASAIARKRETATGLQPASVATGAALGMVVLVTGGFGMLTSTPVVASLAGAMGLCGAVVIGRNPKRESPPILTARAKTVIGVIWLACAGLSQAAVATTVRDLNAWFDAAPRATAPAPGPRPHVLLVVLDTLRVDRVGVYGQRRLTPQLDAFAEHALIYTQAYSTAPWTLPTHASLFTGQYPSQHDVSWGHFGLGESPDTLAEIFSRQGYATRALSNNCLLSPDNGYDRGFDSFLELSYHPKLMRWRFALRCGLPKALAAWAGLHADAGYDQGAALTNWMIDRHVKTISASERPTFTFINYYEPHDPYLPPARFREARLTPEQQAATDAYVQSRDDLVTRGCGVHGAVSDEELELLEALYDAEVAYQDERFGELVSMFRDAALWDNTWIIVTADHGELFGEHGRAYHSAGTHPQLLHVPLLVRPPGGVPPTTIHAPVQPVDIFATLVGVAGAPLPAQATGAHPLPLTADVTGGRDVCVSQTYGASLFGLSIAQRADMPGDLTRWLTWLTSVYADGYMLELDGTTPTALYDVNADPRADHNLIEERADLVRSLIKRYEAWQVQNPTGDRL